MTTNLLELLNTTAAYQTAVLQLVAGETNFAAPAFELNRAIPSLTATNTSSTWDVSLSPYRASGSVAGFNSTNDLVWLHTTTAYQAAVMQLMVNEANFTARQFGINETVPPPAAIGTNNWDVAPPPRGIGGTVRSANYEFCFEHGKLQWVRKTDWFRKISPPITDLSDLADRPSLLDKNGAYQLATQWLASFSVNVAALEKKTPPVIFQVPGRKHDAAGNYRRDPAALVKVPLFVLGWGEHPLPAEAREALEARLHNTDHPPSPAAREALEARLRDPVHTMPPSPSSPIYIEILGTTKELVQLELRDLSLNGRPVLQLTNAGELLGPLPPPRHFVEELFGGKEAYETVASPDTVEAWLMDKRSYETFEKNFAGTEAPKTVALPDTLEAWLMDKRSFEKKDRVGPVKLAAENVRQFSDALLDFDSYSWGPGGSSASLCIVDYGARLRFTRGDDAVEIQLCFECDALEIKHYGHSRTASFGHARAALARVLKAAFPNDSVVKGLSVAK